MTSLSVCKAALLPTTNLYIYTISPFKLFESVKGKVANLCYHRFKICPEHQYTTLIRGIAKYQFIVEKMNGKASDLYKNHVVQQPSTAELRGIAENLGISTTEDELRSLTGLIGGFGRPYDRVAELSETVGDMPAVKYPRTPGRKPRPEENPHRAWTYQTEIIGAPSGILKGKTVAIKDNVSVAGVPMMNGSHLLDSYLPKYDATVVTRLLDSGATISGKAACEDFCFSGGSFTCVTGPVLNPIDPTRTPGGSSCGSAVLVANGEVDMAIGGDQGGSIRIPSSWCGLVGLKPTYGLVPYTGAASIEPTIDHLGPITKTVKDCALMLEAIAGFDPFDPRQDRTILENYNFTSQLSGDIKGKKIGLLKEGFAACQDDVQSVVREAAKHLEAAGAKLEEVSVQAHSDANDALTVVTVCGGFQTIMENSCLNLGTRGYHDADLHSHVYNMQKSRTSEWSPFLKMVLLLGNYMKKHYGSKMYAKAQNLVPWITAEYDRILSSYDVLLMPTLPYTAPKLPSADASMPVLLKAAEGMTVNMNPFDLTGHPALTINAGYSQGLPVGMQLVGKKFDEASILNIAYSFEKIMTQ